MDPKELATYAPEKRSEGIAIQGTLWSELPDVHQVPQFSDSDEECIREVRDVLKRYNQLERFGIALLHKHFEIAEDEFLLETTDVKGRTQLIRPVKAKDYIGRKDFSMMATIVKLVEGDRGPIFVMNCGCLMDSSGHTGNHTPPQ